MWLLAAFIRCLLDVAFSNQFNGASACYSGLDFRLDQGLYAVSHEFQES